MFQLLEIDMAAFVLQQQPSRRLLVEIGSTSEHAEIRMNPLSHGKIKLRLGRLNNRTSQNISLGLLVRFRARSNGFRSHLAVLWEWDDNLFSSLWGQGELRVDDKHLIEIVHEYFYRAAQQCTKRFWHLLTLESSFNYFFSHCKMPR